MKLLIITPINPYPLLSGGAQAVFNMIDKLRDQIDICLLCFYSFSRIDIRNLSTLREKWPNVKIYNYSYLKRIHNYSFVFSKTLRLCNKLFYSKSSNFKKDVILNDYGFEIDCSLLNYINDIISFNKINIVQVEFYPLVSLVCGINASVKTVFVHHELRFVRNELALRSFLPLSLYDNYRFNKSKANEIAMCNLYDAVITLTEVDKEKLIKEGVQTNISVSPAAIQEIKDNNSGYKYQFNDTFTFIGGVSHAPNREGLLWFLDNVWPLVINNYPMLHLNVIGTGWNKVLRKRIANVNLLGFVDDLSSALKNTILVVPILTGSGMRMKILDGVKNGIPFVTTSVGVEGLGFRNNVECYIADSAQLFAEKIISLALSQHKQADFISSSLLLYEQQLSNSVLVKKRFEIYDDIMNH